MENLKVIDTKENLKEFISKVIEIQTSLKVPKNQYNVFGGFSYRNCEDILEALKPHLRKHQLELLFDCEVVIHNNQPYQKAKAIITDGINYQSSIAEARECELKKGMSLEQLSGSALSYAKKYALCGLFLIDDTKDTDTQDNRENQQTSASSNATVNNSTQVYQ